MDKLTNLFKQDLNRRRFLEMMGKAGLASLTLGVLSYEPQFAWGSWKVVPIESNNPAIVWNEKNCKRCGKCVDACNKTQTVLGHYNSSSIICVHCGQCGMRCSNNAIVERDHTARVWQAINNSNIHVVVQTAPATRVSLGELFGLKAGTNVEGKQVTALKQLGFNAVFDTTCTADLTVMEEATELVKRLKGEINKPAPQFTSCSPGWVKFCEHFFPECLPNMSTCKSPQQMMGTLVKTYYAQKKGINKSNIFTVAVMPCTAKKFECQRPEMNSAGAGFDVDAVLTTRELANMIKSKGIDLNKLSNSPYDSLLGEKTGAGVIFGSSGGVMEAAVRTAYYLLTNQDPPSNLFNFTAVRGLTGIKESQVSIPGFGTLNVAVCQGLANGRNVLGRIKAGTASWHFIEFMACPGGCVGGGGQPKTTDNTRTARANGLYSIDSGSSIRLSYKNAEVNQLYKDFLGGQPGSSTAYSLLHTQYTVRGIN